MSILKLPLPCYVSTMSTLTNAINPTLTMEPVPNLSKTETKLSRPATEPTLSNNGISKRYSLYIYLHIYSLLIMSYTSSIPKLSVLVGILLSLVIL